ncbi:MAG TPA: FGGY-family carbohydrate kinase [Terriglobales bacterium]|nr:FGGY-family carbohydrate kinase [Terriglobales bacterium]
MAWIAIDAGTSVIKAVAFADDGSELAMERQPSEVLRPHSGFSEQDMNGTWNAVLASVHAINKKVSEPIRGIVTTAQGDGCWLIDSQGSPVRNAILWNDGRAADIVQQWHDNGVLHQAFRLSGSLSYAGLPNAILAWLSKHEPGTISKSKSALTCNGWLFYRFTGELAADLSDASNPFSDVRAEQYSPRLLELYGAQAFAELLPPIAVGRKVVAPLSGCIAQQLGLTAGIPVVMAPYDIVATALGSGAVSQGQACVILGTTICSEVILSSLNLDGPPAGTTIALGRRQFLRAMPTLTGCESLHWAARTFSCSTPSELDALASSSEPTRDGPFFLPYLSPAGERAPFLDSSARGSFHGLTLAHDRAHLARTVYEGLSFVIRDCLENAYNEDLQEVRVCGGGAQSDFWCQMIADVVGVKVLRPRDTETGARGAYVFGLSATGEIASSADGIRQHIQTAASFGPSREWRIHYDRRYQLFREVRTLSAPQWHLQAGRK